MGAVTTMDLPRYHPLVQEFNEFANCWMGSGHLRGPAHPGGGYLLDLSIPLSGDEGDSLMSELDRVNDEEEEW